MPLCVVTKPSITPPPVCCATACAGGQQSSRQAIRTAMNPEPGSHPLPLWSIAFDQSIRQAITSKATKRSGQPRRSRSDSARRRRRRRWRRRGREAPRRPRAACRRRRAPTASEPAAWPLGNVFTRIDRCSTICDREPVNRRIRELRLALERPRRARLDERQRRERHEFGAHHHRSSSDRRAQA